MGDTRMPCAPNSFKRPIISQKRFSSSTVCIEHQFSSAKGMMVGLFIPGNTAVISFTLLFGAFIITYFLSVAERTASIRNNISLRIACLSSSSFQLAISRASLSITTSTSLRLLLMRVLPELTISNMPSARPIPGQISTLPVITCISAVMPFS